MPELIGCIPQPGSASTAMQDGIQTHPPIPNESDLVDTLTTASGRLKFTKKPRDGDDGQVESLTFVQQDFFFNPITFDTFEVRSEFGESFKGEIRTTRNGKKLILRPVLLSHTGAVTDPDCTPRSGTVRIQLVDGKKDQVVVNEGPNCYLDRIFQNGSGDNEQVLVSIAKAVPHYD